LDNQRFEPDGIYPVFPNPETGLIPMSIDVTAILSKDVSTSGSCRLCRAWPADTRARLQCWLLPPTRHPNHGCADIAKLRRATSIRKIGCGRSDTVFELIADVLSPFPEGRAEFDGNSRP
jgi:hypothetical protein